MLAELLVPVFLPGIALLGLLLVLKTGNRSNWAGFAAGLVLSIATLVGFAYEGAWPTSFSDWHNLPLLLSAAGFLTVALVRCPGSIQSWCAPIALGTLAAALGDFPDMSTPDRVVFGISVLVSVRLWMLACQSSMGRLVGVAAWTSCVAIAPMALDGGFTTLMVLSASGATIAGALVLVPQALSVGGGGGMLLGVLLPSLACCGFAYDYAEAPWWQWAGVAFLPVGVILFFEPVRSPDDKLRRPWASGLFRSMVIIILLGWLLQPTILSLVAPADDPYGSY